jgi:hypothetical protein
MQNRKTFQPFGKTKWIRAHYDGAARIISKSGFLAIGASELRGCDDLAIPSPL